MSDRAGRSLLRWDWLFRAFVSRLWEKTEHKVQRYSAIFWKASELLHFLPVPSYITYSRRYFPCWRHNFFPLVEKAWYHREPRESHGGGARMRGQTLAALIIYNVLRRINIKIVGTTWYLRRIFLRWKVYLNAVMFPKPLQVEDRKSRATPKSRAQILHGKPL
jgi:hypothetical protein